MDAPDFNDVLSHSVDQLRINAAGWTRCWSGWQWSWRTWALADEDLWVVLDGRGTMRTQQGDFPLFRGTCFVLQQDDLILADHDPQQPLLVSWTHFSRLRDGKTAYLPSAEQRLPIHRVLNDVLFFEGLLKRLWYAQVQANNSREARHWLASCLTELHRQQAEGLASETERPFEDLCRRMVDEPGAPWRIAEVAASMHLSPDHFTRLFKKIRGVPPQEFLLNQRMQVAIDRLQQTNDAVSVIARSVGYDDQRFFTRLFKKKTGLTPTAFRARPTLSQ